MALKIKFRRKEEKPKSKKILRKASPKPDDKPKRSLKIRRREPEQVEVVESRPEPTGEIVDRHYPTERTSPAQMNVETIKCALATFKKLLKSTPEHDMADKQWRAYLNLEITSHQHYLDLLEAS